MAADRELATIGDIADVTKLAGFEFTKHVKYDATGEIIALRALNLRDGALNLDSVQRISKASSDGLPRSKLYQNDILFSYTGTVGEVAMVDENDKYHLAPNICRLRVKAPTEPKYVFYYLRSPVFRELLSGYVVGSTQPTIPMKNIRRIEIPIPTQQEQRAIVQILGTLDNKIELNRRMNETLEAMARALFKSWFMSVKSKRVRAEDLVRDGILEIGDGYRAKNGEFGGPGLPFIRAGNLDGGFDTAGADILGNDSVTLAGNKVSRVGDVAFTSKGTIGRFARVTTNTERFVYSPQVCFWRSLDALRLNPAILYCWMVSDDLLGQILAAAGQTDMAPYVSLQDQRRMTMPIFPPAQLEIGRRIELLFARQDVCRGESRTLGSLRDALLPKLISGELRTREAARRVEQAVA